MPTQHFQRLKSFDDEVHHSVAKLFLTGPGDWGTEQARGQGGQPGRRRPKARLSRKPMSTHGSVLGSWQHVPFGLLHQGLLAPG